AAIIKGIAEDGGLFVPETIPQINKDLYKVKSNDYKELAFLIVKGFFTDYHQDELKYCINQAYDKKFDTPTIAPLTKKMGVYFLELYHGPTLGKKGLYQINSEMKKKLKDFYGGFAPQEESRQYIKEVFEKSKYLLDPHTAVGYFHWKHKSIYSSANPFLWRNKQLKY
ncbi:unnamed protein product, partial [marine sediment metagenome]